MKRLLQHFGFKQSLYERPNQKWICGRAGRASPCLAGPDDCGRCQASAECRPLKRGDRWQCTRPEACGGPCSDGPGPDGTCACPIPKCQPVRSLRSWRGIVTVMTVAVALGLLAIVMATDAGRTAMSSGDLSFAHSSSGSQCTDCHPGSSGTPIQWLMSDGDSRQAANSEQCLKCHNIGSHPLHVHSKLASELEETTHRLTQHGNHGDRPVELVLSAGLFKAPDGANAGPACSACHLEHQGKDHDLRTLSNTRCQSCHAVQFSSFAEGHPGFGGYPFDRRTRMIFDHASHFKQHFKDDGYKSNVPKSCTDCHMPGPNGRVMLVKPFEETCAACHAGQIQGVARADAPGIAFFRLPGLDAQTLAKKGMPVGDWPEFAEGKLTPFMTLLLAVNPDQREVSERLAKVDLLELNKADPATLQAAYKLAWSVKSLLADLSAQGQREVVRRLQVSGKPLTAAEVEAMTGLLSPDIIDSAARSWFPNLTAEVSAHRAGTALPAAPPATASPPLKAKIKPEDWVQSGGWYRSDTDYSVLYRPAGHADRFLSGWLDLTVDSSRFQETTAAQSVFSQLAASRSPGVCTKCHSVDATPKPHVNWRVPRPTPMDHKFTKFSHRAHFGLLDDKGCQMCHSLDEQAPKDAYASAFAKDNRNPEIFHPNFHPVSRDMCSSCHIPQFAGDSCLLCHNYHVGTILPPLTKLAEFAPPTPRSRKP